jgi:hypothetical protein
LKRTGPPHTHTLYTTLLHAGIVAQVGKYALVMQHYRGGSLFNLLHGDDNEAAAASPSKQQGPSRAALELVNTWPGKAKLALQIAQVQI